MAGSQVGEATLTNFKRGFRKLIGKTSTMTIFEVLLPAIVILLGLIASYLKSIDKSLSELLEIQTAALKIQKQQQPET